MNTKRREFLETFNRNGFVRLTLIFKWCINKPLIFRERAE